MARRRPLLDFTFNWTLRRDGEQVAAVHELGGSGVRAAYKCRDTIPFSWQHRMLIWACPIVYDDKLGSVAVDALRASAARDLGASAGTSRRAGRSEELSPPCRMSPSPESSLASTVPIVLGKALLDLLDAVQLSRCR